MKPYTLEARLGKRRVNRKFRTQESAEIFARSLRDEYPEWRATDFIVITKEH